MNMSYRIIVAHLFRKATDPVVRAKAEKIVSDAFTAAGFSSEEREVTLEQINTIRKTLAKQYHSDVSSEDRALFPVMNSILDEKKIRPEAKLIAEKAIAEFPQLSFEEIQKKIWDEHFAVIKDENHPSFGLVTPEKLSMDKFKSWGIIDAHLAKHFGVKAERPQARPQQPAQRQQGPWHHDVNDPKYGPSSGAKAGPGGTEVPYMFTEQYKQVNAIMGQAVKDFNAANSNDLNSIRNLLDKLNKAEKDIYSIMKSVDEGTELHKKIKETLSQLQSNKQVVLDRIFPRV